MSNVPVIAHVLCTPKRSAAGPTSAFDASPATQKSVVRSPGMRGVVQRLIRLGSSRGRAPRGPSPTLPNSRRSEPFLGCTRGLSALKLDFRDVGDGASTSPGTRRSPLRPPRH